MSIEVYWISGSPYAWRVLLTLAVKNVPYASHLLEASKGQLQSPEYLALNPRGKVPTLTDGDVVLPESLAIMAYLDRKYPDPPLFGRIAADTGRIWKAIADSAYYLEPKAALIVRPFFSGAVAEKADEIRAAARDVHGEFALMDKLLAAQAWLASGALGAADIAVYPLVELLLRMAAKTEAAPLDLDFLPLARRYPAIEAWRARIRALPGYEQTYPPHWRERAKVA